MTSAYPLAWPTSWPRAVRRAPARFRVSGMGAAITQTLAELRRLGARDVVISTNVEVRLDGLPRAGQRIPPDPGVAVYFNLRGRPAVLACDAWDRPEHNLLAIARHVEAMRGQIRWGVGTVEQAFTGYLALPPASTAERPWWVVMGFDDAGQTPEVVRECYRLLALERHPDRPGGTAEAFAELGRAYREGMRACGGEARP